MRVDGTGGVSIGLAVDRQVAVAGDGDPLSRADRVVVDGFAVGICGQELGEHAAAGRPVSLLGSDVFRSCCIRSIIADPMLAESLLMLFLMTHFRHSLAQT